MKMMKRNPRIAVLIASVSFSFLGACDQATETTVEPDRPEPVVVYAAYEDDAALRELLSRYTAETGVLVIIRRGAADNIVEDLIENRVSPPADILMTRSVTGVWRAAEEGALRPLYSETMRRRSPDWSRDPDDLWFGTDYRMAVIVHKLQDLTAADLPDFAALAGPQFDGSICLSSSANPVNRSVVAMMIDAMGVRPAEIAVRGWMANLALPVFDTEAQVLDAITAGSCDIGIVSHSAVDTFASPKFSVLTPETTYVDIDGIGLARHARNPDGAAALIEWLSLHSASEWGGAKNVSRKNVGLVAWHENDAAKLAERAHYP